MKLFNDLAFPIRTHHGERSRRADIVEKSCELFIKRFSKKSEKYVSTPIKEELYYIKELAEKGNVDEFFLRRIIYGRNFKEIEV